MALFEELFARANSDRSADAGPELTPDDVLAAFATKSGIPEFLLRDERSLLLHEVEHFFRQHVIGQERAVRRVAETLCTVKAGLQPAGKPLATLFFLGPTGVGKTELSKALARFLFGSAERMARFDMSEYTDPLAADRLNPRQRPRGRRAHAPRARATLRCRLARRNREGTSQCVRSLAASDG
ncbi:MAG: AAA family ATPase [Pseudomonadota bacterium]